MLPTNTAKTNVLEFFYDYVTEDDWLEGLDIYQAGRVSGVTNYEGLITSHVASLGPRKAEVRIKIHPNGKTVQWLECTCAKNRAQNRYCEHMVAMMIHLDREQSELLANLDTRMPMKPPVATRRKAVPKLEVKTDTETSNARDAGAAQMILNHLKGSIHSASLIAHGPTLRVRLEIKSGQLTHYDLQLDSAAKFLLAHPDLKVASAEVKRLKVFKNHVHLGTRIYQAEDEKILAERIVAVPVNSDTPDSKRDEAQKNKHLFVSRDKVSEKPTAFEFVPIKTASKTLGKEYFFMNERGYWPVSLAEVTSEWHELPLKKTFKEDDAAYLLKSRFAEFLEQGPVFLETSLAEPVVLEAPKLSEIKVRSEEADGWFTLDPIYGSEGSRISMAELMRHFKQKKRSYIKSGNVWLKIPELVTEHAWDLDESGQFLRVNALGLMRLKAAVGDFDSFVGSKHILNQIRQKTEFTNEIEAPDVRQTNLTLREYQETGLRWLWWLYNNHLHGLLADEMGLGKTHQAMGLMSAIQAQVKQPKMLVICPTTVLDHWEDKVGQFCPALKPAKHHGAKRTHAIEEIFNESPLLITSYGVLLRDIRQFVKINWDLVVLDEAHFAKNNDTATYQAVCRLNSRMRLCLTGTPMENHLGELKNIFDFLVPGYFGSNDYFKKQFVQPIGSGAIPERELALQKLIYPFKMRRTKSQVLKDLPPKVEDIRHCSLSEEQVDMYRKVLSLKATPLISQLKDESTPIPYMHVFATLTMLKQICNHPALVLEGRNYKKSTSGKFELMKELLQEALNSDHKVVIFSQYVHMIRIIEEYLQEIQVPFATLTGQTRNRGDVIKRFQTDYNCKVFLGSLLAGGIGIDLTAASVVIHYDRWWNASKENQATDRVHRIGQNKNVQVLKLVTRGTLEEKIDAMIRAKQSLFEKFLDKDEEVFKTLSRQELIDLLQ